MWSIVVLNVVFWSQTSFLYVLVLALAELVWFSVVEASSVHHRLLLRNHPLRSHL